MKDYTKTLVRPNISMREALVLLDQTAYQILLVVDTDNKLIGTLTDGDIRRGLLKGMSLEDCIDPIIFRAPTVAYQHETKQEIITKAVAKRIHQIPIVDDKNKVIDLKEIDELIQPEKRHNTVVLMVGGLGTRLHPLTKDTPKPMLKVGNKPILQTIVERFASYGFTNVIMCVNYKASIIQDYFGDGHQFGVSIEYVLEKTRMGTAGALTLLKSRPTEPFFVMNGDLLTDVNFESLCEYHYHHQAKATMCVREYDFEVPYGVVNIEGHKVQSIVEKPVHKFFVSAGVYMFDPVVINHIPHGEYFDIPSLFDILIQKNQQVVSFPIHEYWLDIGRINEYDQANRDYGRVFDV